MWLARLATNDLPYNSTHYHAIFYPITPPLPRCNEKRDPPMPYKSLIALQLWSSAYPTGCCEITPRLLTLSNIPLLQMWLGHLSAPETRHFSAGLITFFGLAMIPIQFAFRCIYNIWLKAYPVFFFFFLKRWFMILRYLVSCANKAILYCKAYKLCQLAMHWASSFFLFCFFVPRTIRPATAQLFFFFFYCSWM